jgi:hypothetical protein
MKSINYLLNSFTCNSNYMYNPSTREKSCLFSRWTYLILSFAANYNNNILLIDLCNSLGWLYYHNNIGAWVKPVPK